MIEWIQDNSGFGREIGKIGRGKPVFVSFSFYAIGGKYICFYNATSRFVDWTMVEDYIKKFAPKYDNGHRTAMTDANNFHHCLHFCQE